MVEIEPGELRFTFSSSSGPGGQHVNRAQTRVTLWVDVQGSPSLDERQKQVLFERLAGRISKDGVLRVVSQRHRTQVANRRAAVERFHELVDAALRPRKPRKATRVPAGSKRRRVETKRQRAEVKRGRGRVPGDG